jgi:hypothetical protein
LHEHEEKLLDVTLKVRAEVEAIEIAPPFVFAEAEHPEILTSLRMMLWVQAVTLEYNTDGTRPEAEMKEMVDD